MHSQTNPACQRYKTVTMKKFTVQDAIRIVGDERIVRRAIDLKALPLCSDGFILETDLDGFIREGFKYNRYANGTKKAEARS